jgi:hypothetical protein
MTDCGEILYSAPETAVMFVLVPAQPCAPAVLIDPYYCCGASDSCLGRWRPGSLDTWQICCMVTPCLGHHPVVSKRDAYLVTTSVWASSADVLIDIIAGDATASGCVGLCLEMVLVCKIRDTDALCAFI